MNKDLPQGWFYARLSELGELARGKSKHRPRNDPKLYGNVMPFIQTGEVARSGGLIRSFSKMYSEFGVEQGRVFPKGTICITIAANIADTGILDFDACFPDSVVGLITDDTLADSQFVEFFLRTARDDIAQFAPATAQANINLEILSKVVVPLPPLNEQRRIVAKIEALKARSQGVKEELEAIAPLLDQFRQSVLAAAFRGDLTADWREKNPDVEPASVLLDRISAERRRRWEEAELEKMKVQGKTPKDDKWKEKYKEPVMLDDMSHLAKIPDGWIWTRAEQICDWITNGYTPKSDKMYEMSGDIPFIKVYNLTKKGTLDFSINPTFIDKETHDNELRRSKIFPGDVLMNIVGPPLGKVSIVPDTFDEWNINQAIVIYRPVQGLKQEFLCFALLTEPIINFAINQAKTTTSQVNLTLTISRNLPLPLPSLPEQQVIIKKVKEYLASIERIKALVNQKLNEINRLDQSILAKAFRGELVPQDPNDEPASMLLERIKAEREKLDTKKKAKDKTEKKSRKAKPEPEPKQLSFPGFE